jgi:hypothetical protein
MCFGAWDARVLRRAGSTGAVGARLSLRPLVQRVNEIAEPGRKRVAGMRTYACAGLNEAEERLQSWRPTSPSGFAGQAPLLRYERAERAAPSVAAKQRSSEAWCPWPESNQHSLRNSILSRARLPVPPQGPSGTSPGNEGRWRSRRNIAAARVGSTRADVIMPRLDRKSRARYRYGVEGRGDDCDTHRHPSVA